MTIFTIGADPEVFVKKNGKPFSAHGLVDGTKESPLKTENGAIQVDGLALEFNIDPTPLDDFNQFNKNILSTLKELKTAAQNNVSNGKINLVAEPTQEFGKEYLDALPDEAKELGCDPDYNAYTCKENPKPDGEATFRTGAGHIHVGWGTDIPVENEEHIKICADFVKMLDGTVGMFMTYIDRDPKRRNLYGKAGAMRPKPYGVEYRTPSNVWITSKNYRKVVHELIKIAIARKKYGESSICDRNREYSEAEVIEIINTGDWKKAKKIVSCFLASSSYTYGKEWRKIVEKFKERDNNER